MELHTYYQKRAKLRFALGTILLLFALYGIYKSGKDLVIGQLLLVLTASAICYIAGWRQLSFSKQQERTMELVISRTVIFRRTITSFSIMKIFQMFYT